jgi:hypothetical protein
MTFLSLDPPRMALALDAEDRRALAALAERIAALRPFVGPALMIRLQLAGLLVGYLLAALVIAAGLLGLLGRV